MDEHGKVTIHISGEAMDAQEGYDLKYLINALENFEKLSEKTYLYLISKDRLSKKDKENFGVYINEFRHGSFKADLWIKFETYVLPLIPVIGEHGGIIWNCILNSFNFFKDFSEAKQQGKIVTVESISDEAILVIGDNNNVTINKTYPSYVTELAPKLAPQFVEMSKAVDGNVEKLAFAHGDEGISLNESDKELFETKEYLSPTEMIVTGTITVLNSHKNTGKIQITKGDLPLGEYRFDVQKDIRYPEYLASSMRKELSYRCYVKIKFDPSKVEEKIIGIRLIEKL